MKRNHILACALLCLVALAVFLPVLTHDFAPFDDDLSLIHNPHIQSFSAENLRWMFTDTQLTLRYAPFSWIIWTALYTTFGPAPLSFHALTLSLHLLNILLVYALILQFGKTLGRTIPPAICLFATALWALHPLRVEVINWALMAHYEEATAAALGSTLFYLRFIRGNTHAFHSTAFYAALACFAASVLFYPVAVCLPAVLFVLDIYLRRPVPVAKLLAEKIPFAALAAAVGIITILGRAASAATMWGAPASLAEFGIIPRIMQGSYVLIRSVWKPLDPWHLSPIYTVLIDFNPGGWVFLLSLAALTAFSLTTILLRKRAPALLALWSIHLLLILPFGGFFDHPFIPGDRHLYCHDILFAVIAALLLAKLTPILQRQWRIYLAAGLLASVFSLMCIRQSRMWQNFDAFFNQIQASIGDHPFQSVIDWQRARWCNLAGRFPEAIILAERSYAIDPRQTVALTIKAEAYTRMGEALERAQGPTAESRSAFGNAAQTLERLNAADPHPEAWMTIASLYDHAALFADSDRAFSAALQLAPREPKLRLLYARCLYLRGRDPEALEQLDTAIALWPAQASNRRRYLDSWTQLRRENPPPPTSSPQVPSQTAPSTSASR